MPVIPRRPSRATLSADLTVAVETMPGFGPHVVIRNLHAPASELSYEAEDIDLSGFRVTVPDGTDL